MYLQRQNANGRFLSLVDMLRYRADHQSNHCTYTFLANRGKQEIKISCAELDRRARAVGAMLQRFHSIGERSLILLPPGLDYITAFFGILYGASIAVPVYPPQATRSSHNIHKLQSIVRDSKPKFIITDQNLMQSREIICEQLPELYSATWFCISDLWENGEESQWKDIEITDETLAMLQYTSGSTSVPKGVMLSHGNFMSNLQKVEECFGHSPDTRGAIWLPPYHDMGLSGGILQVLYCGGSVTMMSPLTFIQRPIRWLELITRIHATTVAAPNFAYDLCVRKISEEQKQSLDLSSLVVAANGAEAVRVETMDRFCKAFASCGFRKEAFYPCYGLAEATLIATGGDYKKPALVHSFDQAKLTENIVCSLPKESEKAIRLVASGTVVSDHTIAIVDASTCQRCENDQVGEIWLSGPSIAKGYWEAPEKTEATFNAYIKPGNEGPYLRTGDLGFIYKDELFVMGRLKDLIILDGRNHHPQDIELTVESSHQVIRPFCSAAFSVEKEGQEKLIVVVEIDRASRARIKNQETLEGETENVGVELCEIVNAIRASISEIHEIQVDEIVLVKSGNVPKTSSGKVQRFACRIAFVNNDLARIEG